MSIKLEALSAAEGIGIALVNGQLRLLQPPYSRVNTPSLPKDALQDAIAKCGFASSGNEFESWEDLIAYLDGGVAAARRTLGIVMPDVVDKGAVLESAPPEIIKRFLERVRNELIPQRQFDPAEDFLLSLLNSSAGKSNPDIFNTAVALIKECKKARKKSEASQRELATQDIRFPSLQDPLELERSSRVAERIRERGCVFA